MHVIVFRLIVVTTLTNTLTIVIVCQVSPWIDVGNYFRLIYVIVFSQQNVQSYKLGTVHNPVVKGFQTIQI